MGRKILGVVLMVVPFLLLFRWISGSWAVVFQMVYYMAIIVAGMATFVFGAYLLSPPTKRDGPTHGNNPGP